MPIVDPTGPPRITLDTGEVINLPYPDSADFMKGDYNDESPFLENVLLEKRMVGSRKLRATFSFGYRSLDPTSAANLVRVFEEYHTFQFTPRTLKFGDPEGAEERTFRVRITSEMPFVVGALGDFPVRLEMEGIELVPKPVTEEVELPFEYSRVYMLLSGIGGHVGYLTRDEGAIGSWPYTRLATIGESPTNSSVRADEKEGLFFVLRTTLALDKYDFDGTFLGTIHTFSAADIPETPSTFDVQGMGIDPINNIIYFGYQSVSPFSAGLLTCDYDGNVTNPYHKNPATMVTGIAPDYEQFVYFMMLGFGTNSLYKYDTIGGGDPTQIGAVSSSNNFNHSAIDPEAEVYGRMNIGQINCITHDSSDASVIATVGTTLGGWGSDIDRIGDKVFFARFTKVVRRSNFDGTDVEDLNSSTDVTDGTAIRSIFLGG